MPTATKSRSRRSTKKAAPLEEDLEEDDELEEDEDQEDEDEEVEEEPAPKSRRRSGSTKTVAKKTPAKAAPKSNGKAEKADVLGSQWLKDHVNEQLGSDHESTKLRIVLRKLIKDGTIESPKDGRYIFTGPRDPNVKAVIKALRDEAKAGPTKRGRKPKAAAEVDDDDEDAEDLDLD